MTRGEPPPPSSVAELTRERGIFLGQDATFISVAMMTVTPTEPFVMMGFD